MTKRILLFALLSFMVYSCVDHNYDIDDIDDDDMVILKDMVLPLATTGEVYLNGLVNIDEVTEIMVEDGKYNVRIADDLIIPAIDDITIDDWYQAQDYTITAGVIDGNLGSNVNDLLINTSELSFGQFGIGAQISSIDSVLFADNSLTTFIIDIPMTGVSIGGTDFAQATFKFKMVMPNGFEFEKTGVDNRITLTVDPTTKKQIVNMSIILTTEPYVAFPFVLKVKKLGAIESSVVSETKADVTIYIEMTTEVSAVTIAGGVISIGTKLDNIDFESVYGFFDINEQISARPISMEDIFGMFESGAVLDFYNPMIKIDGTHNIGINAQFDMVFAALSTVADVSLPIDIPVGKAEFVGDERNIGITLSPLEPDVVSDNWYEFDVNRLLAVNPTEIVISGGMNTFAPAQGKNSFVTSAPIVVASYLIDIPFAAGSDFNITMSEHFKDVLTSDITDFLFVSGTVKFLGEVKNTLPLELLVKMEVLDESGNIIDVDWEPVSVGGSKDGTVAKGDILFEVLEEDMPKMQSARSVQFRINALSNDLLKGVQIKETDYIDIRLSVHKSGGLSI